MNELDRHAKALKNHIKHFSRDITFISPAGVETVLKAIWNSVEYVLNIDLSADPMTTRNVIYIDKDTLNTAGINPLSTWTVRGSPNAYEPVKTYKIAIPKNDYQVTGNLYFLEEISATATSWKPNKVNEND